MAATLNMNYLDQLGVSWDSNANEIKVSEFSPLIRHSQVRQEFSEMGYQFISFQSVFPFIDITDSDIYFDYQADIPFYNKMESLSFNYLFLRTTLLLPVVGGQEAHPEVFASLPPWVLKLINPKAGIFATDQYQKFMQSRYELEKLGKIPDLNGRKFVYAHLLITHSPYVFNPDGTMRKTRGEGTDAYRDQIIFLDDQLIEIVKTILDQSETQPIIIIQGDHSDFYGTMRDEILNAYYLPDGGNDLIYPTITPVNTFRLILDNYFAKEYPLLEDHSYIAKDNKNLPYQVEEIPATCVK